MIKFPHFLFLSLFVSQISIAASTGPDAKTLQSKWSELLTDTEINSVEPGPIPGLWEVDAGVHVFYTTDKGDKLILGDILTLDPKAGYVNLTEDRRKEARVQAIKKLDTKDMINFTAKNSKHDMYVFTDPDCGYCRKLHSERQALLDNGISLHYLAMPRTPPGTPSYNKSVAIWCASDRNKALTEAKDDTFKDVEKTCPEGEKIVAADVELAKQLGAQGTPTIVLDTGQVIPGYAPAQKLIEYYDQNPAPTTK